MVGDMFYMFVLLLFVGMFGDQVMIEDLVMQVMLEVGSGVEVEQLVLVSELVGLVWLINQMIVEV